MTSYSHLEEFSAEQVVRWAWDMFGSKLVVLTSFQDEGMVLVDMAARISPDVRVVTLDTGRLPEDTYVMIETVRKLYGVRVETVLPDAGEVENMVTRFGPNLFYDSVAQRSLCCKIRKVRPLERKLREFPAYIVGLRRGQSETREYVPKVDTVDGVLKISPLADWSAEDVHRYLARYSVPRHPLYEKGYTSIGCGPCTRPTQVGEHERAGRWWWEEGASKECGLHFSPEGKAERTVDVLLREILSVQHA